MSCFKHDKLPNKKKIIVCIKDHVKVKDIFTLVMQAHDPMA